VHEGQSFAIGLMVIATTGGIEGVVTKSLHLRKKKVAGGVGAGVPVDCSALPPQLCPLPSLSPLPLELAGAPGPMVVKKGGEGYISRLSTSTFTKPTYTFVAIDGSVDGVGGGGGQTPPLLSTHNHACCVGASVFAAPVLPLVRRMGADFISMLFVHHQM